MVAQTVESQVRIFQADDVVFQAITVCMRDVVQFQVQLVAVVGAMGQTRAFEDRPNL